MSQKQTSGFEFVLAAVMWAILATASVGLHAQATKPPSTDCSSYIGLTKTVGGQIIGPTTCNSSESTVRNIDGVIYRRVEMGVSGAIEGYTMTDGSRYSLYFTDIPEFSLAQRGALGPYVHSIAQYHAEMGSGMTIFVPKSASDWNGKLFVMNHGSSAYPPLGELSPRKPGQYNRLMGANSYVGLAIDKGYAVAYARRGAASGKLRPGDTVEYAPGGETVTLDDGSVHKGKSIDYHVSLLRDFTQIAKNFVEKQLGRRPTRTYWYGKSGGGALGRLINYLPGGNVDAKGERIFDGMVIDDAGGGLYMPTLRFERTESGKGSFSVKADTKDHLIFDDAHKKAFAYQIEIAHQAYAGNDYTLGDYISNKRQNARLLIQKGLREKSRIYEIVGVSHGDAGNVSNSNPELISQNLDLSGICDALFDVLDAWADRGIEPPPTRSDVYDLGDADRDGRLENAAVELPEVGCPLGVYHEFEAEGSTGGRTAFAPFLRQPRQALNADTEPIPKGYDPSWLEPLDSRGYFVDMNKNTVRDTRDSIAQAWQRRAAAGKKHGILGPDEALTHGRYQSCVAAVASELFEQRLLSETAMLDYIRNAENSDIGKTEAPAP